MKPWRYRPNLLVALVLALTMCAQFSTGCSNIDRNMLPPPDVQDMDTGVQDPDTGMDARVDARDARMDAMDISTIPVPIDGGGVYEDADPLGDARTCNPDSSLLCMPLEERCLSLEICNDGLDNDCNGRVDEGCVCVPGTVQRCFAGPPGRRNIGACVDGQQTCQGQGEFGCWGPCQGGIFPSAERCDTADNNCDGCIDNGLCCSGRTGSCPSSGDPRLPVRPPFRPYSLRGRDFYDSPSIVSWEWRVEGGPCDRLIYATSQVVSYELANPSAGDPRVTTADELTFTPTLSGDYTITLTVRGTDGIEFACAFIVPIRAPGVRFELCSDRTADTDIDFWVHEPNSRRDWLDMGSTCYYANCRNNNRLDWGFAPSFGGCREAAADNRCNNPRLDIDSINDEGVPENINVDNPFDGDQFRVAVNYFGGTGVAHPMVNIYCGGQLLGTFGGADVNGVRYGSTPLTTFNTSGGDSTGSIWRVADVTYHADTGQCSIKPLVTRGTTLPCVETNLGRSYDGRSCVPAANFTNPMGDASTMPGRCE